MGLNPTILQLQLSGSRFAAAFVALTLISGITIGMNKVLVTLLALRLKAEPWQIGLFISAESLSMMLMSLPAGVLISRHGARGIYAVASCGAMVLYPLVAHASAWYLAALLLFVAGICIPYRIVAMSTSWLQRLPELGAARAGWYRGTLTLGIGLLGPLIGNLASERFGVQGSYWVTSGLFACMACFGFAILSPGHGTAEPSRIGPSLRAMLSHLGDSMVQQVCIFEGLAGIVRGFFSTFVIVIAVRVFHWTESQGVMVMVTEGAVYVSVLLLLGPLSLRFGDDRLYGAGHASLIVGLLILGLTRNGIGLYAGAVFHALGQGFNHLVNVARIARSTRDKGHVSGLQTLVGMGGGFAGAAVGGVLSRGFALQDIFLLWIPIWLLGSPQFRRLLFRTAMRVPLPRR